MKTDEFLELVKDHEMVIECDQGVNRSILFNDPKNFNHFQIRSFNGYLCFTGSITFNEFLFKCYDLNSFDVFKCIGKQYDGFDLKEFSDEDYAWFDHLCCAKYHNVNKDLYEFSYPLTRTAIMNGSKSLPAKKVEEVLNRLKLCTTCHEASEVLSEYSEHYNEYEYIKYDYDSRLKDACRAIVWGIQQYNEAKK